LGWTGANTSAQADVAHLTNRALPLGQPGAAIPSLSIKVNWGYINSMDAAGALLIAVLGAVILGALTFFRRR
jgi:hypothetical protein